MRSQAIIAGLPFLALAGAIPAPPSTTTTTAAPTVTPIGVEYYLNAQRLNIVSYPNPFYVSASHSGAGENNVTLNARSVASKGFLNPDGGYQEFALGYSYPYGFVMGGETDIKGAFLVAIDAGPGDAGFSIPSREQGVLWNNTAFGGWRACDITEQTTGLQLFWVKKPALTPNGCEKVKLTRESV